MLVWEEVKGGEALMKRRLWEEVKESGCGCMFAPVSRLKAVKWACPLTHALSSMICLWMTVRKPSVLSAPQGAADRLSWRYRQKISCRLSLMKTSFDSTWREREREVSCRRLIGKQM